MDPTNLPPTSTSHANVQQPHWISIVALVAGVVGGLILVISVIVVCKYCFKKSYDKDPEVYRTGSDKRGFRPYRQYESLQTQPSVEEQSEISADSQQHTEDGYNDYPEEQVKLVDEDNKATFSGQCLRELSGIPEEAAANSNHHSDTYEQYEPEDGGERRVSFQLSDIPIRPPSSYFKKGRSMQHDDVTSGDSVNNNNMYTEGDYHYLKKLRIDPVPSASAAKMVRQATVATPEIMAYENVTPRKDASEITREVTLFSDDNVTDHEMEEENYAPNLTNTHIVRDARPHKTEVCVEVHRIASESPLSNGNVNKPSPPRNLMVDKSGRRRQSQSLEVVSPLGRQSLGEARKVRSYDAVLDYEFEQAALDRMNKGPFYNADYDVVSESKKSPCRGRVCYNDTGSYENVNEEKICDELEMGALEMDKITLTESDETEETLNGGQKYRDLWYLRATLEKEEENQEDTVRMEDTLSPSPENESPEQGTSITTSFESTAGYADESDVNMPENKGDPKIPEQKRKQSAQFLTPPNVNGEMRRQNYRSILTKRLQNKMDAPPTASNDNSFDSFETDGGRSTSESSRQEVTTTSFETSTDNTDSTNDSQTHKLQQMKHDSGYKSLEVNKSLDNGAAPVKALSLDSHTPPRLAKKQMRVSFEQDSIDKDEAMDTYPPTEGEGATASAADPTHKRYRKNNNHNHGGQLFDRRAAKTASKKRREFHRERQLVHVYESINEPETDSKSDQPSGDSFEEPATSRAPPQPHGKFSVFTRFFRSSSGKTRHKTRVRDYSIDEKTDQIFNEFLRQDPKYEPASSLSVRSRSPRIHSRHRGLSRKQYTDPQIGESSGRGNKLKPEMRSVSLGSDSSCSSTRKLSPQDSIEEEYLRQESARIWDSGRERHFASPKEHPQSTIHEIPIIKLHTEEEQ
ncbi:uncharacterized protein LOC106168737 isoform X1 [Lingula anatina]|uniref:Uncharacterized protein LOC106168737 isoform X1 n=1 Tax=Lingula anatina TaxID=7574 RepID=A0A1S3IZB7_LINAN|nr:uncharacterized protein LOC106168737 isoform X1 [Lingula anatina]XP_013403359.1 uncharacterized protein LOC106168737 isoform X1 [Lingula anatina]XP_013403360.1 uncharacterized protein LOC106168737 isoform X1 [Lingula anatina]|eukprot:XP_013403358.1 uncharacterized protein LOC106168737 isoform X1 [Lingula anatina]